MIRKFAFAAAALAALAAAPATAETRNYGVSGFTKIRVDGPYAVRVTTGVAPFARAKGGAPDLANVSIRVEGATLVVHADRADARSNDPRTGDPVEVEIGTHDLSSAVLLGSGTLAINRVKGLDFALTIQGSGLAEIRDVAADRLTLAVSGTAASTVAGNAKDVNVVVRGVSSADTSMLKAKTLTAGIEGAGTLRAFASETAKVSGSGPATVLLDGRPSCTLRLKGAGSVSGCR